MRIIAPCTGWVSAGYGVPHRDGGPTQYAVDWGFYNADPGSRNLRAVAAGEVIYTGSAAGYGMHSDFGTIVVLRWVEDGHTWTAIYCHVGQILVSGGAVKAGTVIAVMGATGRVTGTHLHFILLCDGTYVNPLSYLASSASNDVRPFPITRTRRDRMFLIRAASTVDNKSGQATPAEAILTDERYREVITDKGRIQRMLANRFGVFDGVLGKADYDAYKALPEFPSGGPGGFDDSELRRQIASLDAAVKALPKPPTVFKAS